MALANVLNAEVVKDQDEEDGSPFVEPESGRSYSLVAAFCFKALGKEVVGKFPSLRQAIDTLSDFKVDPSITVFADEIILWINLAGMSDMRTRAYS